MDQTSLTDLLAAQQAYAAARNQALEAARAPGADPDTARRLQDEAMLEHLQARVRLLTDAHARATARFEAEIGRYQQKIGEVQQLLREGAPAAPPPRRPKVPDQPLPALGNALEARIEAAVDTGA